MTKRNPTRTLPRTLDAAKLPTIGGGMNKADLTEQLAFCDDMSIELKKRQRAAVSHHIATRSYR